MKKPKLEDFYDPTDPRGCSSSEYNEYSEAVDKYILYMYNKGWNDCPTNNKDINNLEDPIAVRAYMMGWMDYIVGDDVTSVDSLTDKQILDRIKKMW